MRRILAFLRTWAVPALFVVLAALLTVPWTFWVVFAAYERDVNEKTQMLSQRVRLHLDTYEGYERDLKQQMDQFSALAQRLGFRLQQPPVADPRNPFQSNRILDPLKTELLGDNTVQAVVFLDKDRQRGGYVRRHDGIPIPRSEDDVRRMIEADPNSVRMWFPLKLNKGNASGVVYIDLSRRELWNHFWEADGPLLWRVATQTAVAIVVLAAAGIIAWRLWGSAHRQRLRAELEQQGLLAERGLTAAVLAHEIRNPLQALRFQLSSLRRRAGDVERVTVTADTIDAELSRIQQLVQDYLAHEKAQNMRVQPVELADAVTGLQTLMDEFLRDRGTRLLVQRRHDGDVTVACDPHALRQVLMNLVLNAQQAMGYGGTITVSLGRDNGFGTIAVADNGPGIPPEIKDRLFKPFATNKREGSGIGLALVKRFVDNFGGSVAVDSEVGRGTTFHLRLPLASAESAMPVLQYDSRHRPAVQ